MRTVPQCRDYPARAGAATRRPAPTPTPGPAGVSRPRGLIPAARALCRLACRRLTNSRRAPAVRGQTAYGK